MTLSKYPRPVRDIHQIELSTLPDSWLRKHGCLYRVDFDNGKSYIGISLSGAERRVLNHSYLARKKKAKTVLHRAMVKYGPSSYSVTTLVVSDDFDYLKELEIKAIALYKTKVPFGYNMTDGGDGQLGKVWSKESREKLAAWRRGRDTMPPASRKRMARKLRGRVFSEEHRRKLSLSGRNREHYVLGPHTKEHRAKIAAAHIGIGHTTETKARLSTISKEWWKKHSNHTLTEEHKDKISAGNTGKRRTLETRAKLSAIVKEFWKQHPNSGTTGKKHSAETKAKISKALKLSWGTKFGVNSEESL